MKTFIPFIAIVLLTTCTRSFSEETPSKHPESVPRSHSTNAVTVDGKTNLTISVVGQVLHSTNFLWTNGVTLTDAIAVAGGFGDFADRKPTPTSLHSS